MMSMIIILINNLTNTPRKKKNVITMTTVDCLPFVTKDWEYVLVEKESTVFSRVAVDVIAKENRMEYVMPIQDNAPAAMTKKQAGEGDVQLH